MRKFRERPLQASLAALLSIGLAATGCSGPQVSSEHAVGVNVAQYKSFTWAPPVEQQQSKDMTTRPNTILDQSIRTAVDSDLQKKGYRVNDPNAPIQIAYSVRSRDRLQADPFGGPYGGPISSDFNGYTSTYIEKEGSLVLDFIDASTGKLVWRGVAVKDVKDTGINQKDIKSLIDGVMEKFPSRPQNIG